MMTTDQIKTATDADLAKWMANAVATQSCTGHTKGHFNEVAAGNYRNELIARGHDIPTIDFWECFRGADSSYRDKLFETGTYNGKGSF